MKTLSNLNAMHGMKHIFGEKKWNVNLKFSIKINRFQILTEVSND